MSISINDGKGTPVAHVFSQDAQQNGQDPAEFVNRSNANGPSFWERLRGWMTLGTKASQPHVVKVKLSRPIAGTVEGNPAVLGKHEAILTLLIDQSVAAESDVLDTVVLMANLLDNATVRGQMKSFAPLVA
jgi:hypothetical protein